MRRRNGTRDSIAFTLRIDTQAEIDYVFSHVIVQSLVFCQKMSGMGLAYEMTRRFCLRPVFATSL